MSREWEALRATEQAETPAVLDTFGAINPAEFFALADRTFFERPASLHAKQMELYSKVAHFFRQDPVIYFAQAATSP